MKKIIIAIVISFISSRTLATISVIDSANLEKAAQQITYWSKQLASMKEQLEQAKQQYTAITGSKNLGNVLYNPDLYRALPSDYQNIYQSIRNNSGISGTLTEIASNEQLSGSINERTESIKQRGRQSAITNKAVGLAAYKVAEQRLNQIEALMSKINETQDLKAINEIQARISIEKAAIQNEIAKFTIDKSVASS